MAWYCTTCGMEWRGSNKTACTAMGCNGTNAERFPPMDGFVVFEVDPDRPETEDIADRDEWFNRKRVT